MATREPPIIFPIVTGIKFLKISANPNSAFNIFARAKQVIFATLCSKPRLTKAKIHQKIKINFDESDMGLEQIKTARHTRMLHIIPLNKSAVKSKLDFVVASFKRASLYSGEIPVILNKKEIKIDPKRFPM